MRVIWRTLVFIVGIIVLAIGCALIVLPGPAFIVIPAGLAILSIEFEWARRWLHRVRQFTSNAMSRVRATSKRRSM
jgi:tellurite resistance protein TerC